MASTPSSTAADPRFASVALAAAKDQFTDIEEALARLIHTNYAPYARTRAAESDAEAPISPSFEAMLGPAEHQAAEGARGRRSPRRRGLLAPVTLVRVTIVVCLGVCAIWAWGSDGGSASGQATASSAQEATAPPSAPTSIASAGDLAVLRQTVAQLAAGQEQLTRELVKLQAERPQAGEPPTQKPQSDDPPALKPQADEPPAQKPDERMLHRVSAPSAPPLAAPARKAAAKAPMSPPAARRRTPSAPPPSPQPVPQISPQPQLSALPLLRPPMPVPLP